MSLRNAGDAGTGRVAVKQYVSPALANGELTGDSMSIVLPDFPENVKVLGSYLNIDGMPESAGATTGLEISVGTNAAPTRFGQASILDKTGFIDLGGGLNGSDPVRLWLTAKILPDDMGNLADILGLEALQVIAIYVPLAE